MTSTDKIKMDNYIFDLDFELSLLEKHQRDDDDEYTAAYSIVYEQFGRLKDYYTLWCNSPIYK